MLPRVRCDAKSGTTKTVVNQVCNALHRYVKSTTTSWRQALSSQGSRTWWDKGSWMGSCSGGPNFVNTTLYLQPTEGLDAWKSRNLSPKIVDILEKWKFENLKNLPHIEEGNEPFLCRVKISAEVCKAWKMPVSEHEISIERNIGTLRFCCEFPQERIYSG